jgi:peptidoglycan/LPS O-acetylase OafA/YrhL
VQLNPAKMARPVHADGRRYVPAIDGLRCLAAWAVISAHIGSSGASQHLVAYYGAAAYPALIVFFTISGFLVYRPFARKVLAPRPKAVTDEDRSTNFWVYILRRVLRIFPLYWTVLLVALVSKGMISHEPIGLHGLTDWVQATFLLPFPHPMRLLQGPLGIAMWTLAIELPFYVVVPIYAMGLAAFKKKFAPHAKPFHVLVAGTLSLIAFIFTLGLIFGGELAFPVMSLPLGMFLAVLETRQSITRRRYPIIKFLSDNWLVCIVGYVACVFLGAHLALNAYASSAAQQAAAEGRGFDPYAHIRNYYFPIQMVMALLIFLPVAFGKRKSWFVKGMASPPLQILAPLTYGIYLWHVPLIHYTERWFGPGLLGFPVLGTNGFGMPTLFLAILLAITTFVVVELPAAKLRTSVDRWSRGHSPVPATDAGAVAAQRRGNPAGDAMQAVGSMLAGGGDREHSDAGQQVDASVVDDDDVDAELAPVGRAVADESHHEPSNRAGNGAERVVAATSGGVSRAPARPADGPSHRSGPRPRPGGRPSGNGTRRPPAGVAKRRPPGGKRRAAASTGGPTAAAAGPQLATPWCEPIDGFRAICACLAVMGHTFLAAALFPFPGLLHALGILVALFFAISAYVLYQPFLEADVRRLPRPQAGSFYLRRLLRIYPLFAIALTCYLVLLPEVRPDNLWATVRLYFFLQIFGRELAGGQIRGMGSAWYLCNEVIFYFLMPIMAFVAARWSNKRHRRTPEQRLKAHIAIGWGMVVLGPLMRTLLFALDIPGPDYLPLAHLEFLGFGVVIAGYAVGTRLGIQPPSLFRWIRDHVTLSYALVLIPAGALVAIAVIWGDGSFTWASGALDDRLRFYPYLVAIIFLMGAATLGAPRQRSNRWLSSWWMKPISGLALHIYLWHQLVLGLINKLLDKWGYGGIDKVDLGPRWFTGLVLVFVALVGTILVARASQPITDWPYEQYRAVKGRLRGRGAAPQPSGNRPLHPKALEPHPS